MVTRTAEYAVRAILLLARRHSDEPLNAEEIATELSAPRNYLGKTLNTLVRHGLLSSTRGPHGGFVLAVQPEKLSVADIVDLFSEPTMAFSRCITANRPCNPEMPCPAHERWMDVTQRVRAPLIRTMISDLCGPTRAATDSAFDGDSVTASERHTNLARVADQSRADVEDAGRIPISTGTKS